MSLDKSATGSLNKKKIALFVPYNGKIADITHADTNKHTLDLATALSETRKIIVVIVMSGRMAGTGYLNCYPNEGADRILTGSGSGADHSVVIKDGTNELRYALSVANDDFDLYCFGYVVEA
jgi:hypothetical protein